MCIDEDVLIFWILGPFFDLFFWVLKGVLCARFTVDVFDSVADRWVVPGILTLMLIDVDVN